MTTLMADVEFGKLRKVHYKTGDLVGVFRGIVGRQAMANWLDAGKIKSYRTEGSESRKGERYVKHADLVAFLRSRGNQYHESLILIGEEPAPPREGPPPPARTGRKR